MPDPVRPPGRIVVLASGTGSLFASLVAAARQTGGEIEVAAVVTDQPDARVVVRAATSGVPSLAVPLTDTTDRPAWDVAMAETIAGLRPDLVVSAGFMRLLGPAVLDRFPQRIINTHPALLPAFPGAHAVRDALAYGVRVTGCTVHVVDPGVDTGPVIAQRALDVRSDDDEDSLHERIKSLERQLLPEVAFEMLREGWTIDGRKVTIP